MKGVNKVLVKRCKQPHDKLPSIYGTYFHYEKVPALIKCQKLSKN